MDIQENFANNQYKKRNIITFKSLSVDDIGQYLCVAKNIAGQVSREVEVNVEGRGSYSTLNYIFNFRKF